MNEREKERISRLYVMALDLLERSKHLAEELRKMRDGE